MVEFILLTLILLGLLGFGITIIVGLTELIAKKP